MSLGEASTADTLGELQGKGDKFTKLALIEKKKMTDLQDAIQFIVCQTETYRDQAKKAAIDVMNIHVLTPNPAYSRADGVNIGKEAQIVTSKTLNILEAKLNKLLQRKSELKNHIKKMKETINHYRLIRLQTDLSHQKYEQILAETKSKIETILSESTKVVEEREKILEKKDQLERMNLEEQQKFTEEYEEMGRFIKDQNDALENALLQERKADRHHDQKMSKRSSPKTNGGTTNNPIGNATTFDPSHTTTSLSLQEEIEMAKKVGSLNTFMNAEQNSLSDLRDKIATYETMFEQLKKMTNVENLEDMVTNYIAHEEEMFSLYNFIQTVNAEIDMVVESTAQTEQAIAKFKEDQQDQDQQRRSTIDELQQRLAFVLENTRNLVDQNSLQQESILQISKKVSSVFFKLQCDQMDSKGTQGISKSSSRYSSAASNSSSARPDSKIALLTGQGVTESNVLDYLGCIEQRAVDIISEYLRVMHHKETINSSGKLANNAASFANLSGGMRSPTPGPPTPMNWQKREPFVDLGDISDDEYLAALDSIPLTATGTVDVSNVVSLTTVSPANATGLPSATNENENKIVDLNLFKSKLQKKMGIKESSSTPLLNSTKRKLT